MYVIQVKMWTLSFCKTFPNKYDEKIKQIKIIYNALLGTKYDQKHAH